MHEHGKTLATNKNLPTIVLVGNPNVGKSVIFSHLTRKYVTVSNYPGTTVEIAKGEGTISGQKFNVVDTPGINSLIPSSEDEQVTRNLLWNERTSIIVQVADAKNLRRTLLLAFELKELKVPMVIALNMSDEAVQRRINIDPEKLSKILGIPVISTIAIDEVGIADLKKKIISLVPSPVSFHALPILNDGQLKKTLKERVRKVLQIEKEFIKGENRKTLLNEFLGNITMKSLTGFPVLFFVLYIMYVFVGQWAAGDGVDFVENTIFGAFINPWITWIVNLIIPISIIRELIVGEYGIVTMAITYAFAIVFPIVTAFFILFGILEDSGYLPRLAILLNKPFKLLGLNGKAVIPMVLGLGCDTMATITTRTLENKKDRIIATLLLALAIPCSAQLGVILGMLAGVSNKVALIWLGILIAVTFVVGFLAKYIIKGESSSFILEIPPLRMPKITNILIKTVARLEWYLKEAVPLFIYGTLMLFIFDKIHLLKLLENLLSPAVVGILGLPRKAAEAFIVGFLRRDFGAAGLYMMQKKGMLDSIQVLVSLVTITLFVPCVAQFLVMIKERGAKTACAIAAFIFPFAFLIGGLLNFALRYFKVVL